MARGFFALSCLIFFGCANPARMAQQPHLDFGLDQRDMALPLEVPDLAVPVDLAMQMPDQATAAEPDLQNPPDLAPLDDLSPPPMCNDAGTTGHLFLAGVGASNALVTTRFDEMSGWAAYQVANLPAVADVDQTLVAARPLVVARQSDNTLAVSAADPCSQSFPALAAIAFNVTTALRPSALGGDVLFRGASAGDTNLYYMYRPSTIWLGPVKQNNMTTASAFSLARFEGQLEVYYSDAGKLSFGQVQSALGGGPASQILTLTTSQPPVAVVDRTDTLHVVFVGSDTNLYWIWRAAGAAWDNTHVHQLCAGQAGCLIDTSLPIAVTLDSAGTPVVAWTGISPHQVYVTKLLSTAGPQYWDQASAASGTCGTTDCESTLGPALAGGIGNAALELVFVSDLNGKARHSRLLPSDMGYAWAEPVTVNGTNLLKTPALVAEP
jgi:hypothetical protein